MKPLESAIILVFNKKREVLFWINKYWFSKWIINWVWWKREKWETIEEAAVRELFEETWIKLNVQDIEKRVFFTTDFKDKKDWIWEVTIFSYEWFEWELKEKSDELELVWLNIDNIPFEKMYSNTKIRLTKLLKWEKYAEYNFDFDKDWKLLNYEITS